MTGPLRTVIVNPAGVRGGAELWLLSLLDHTDRLDAEVILLADGPLRQDLEQRGIAVTMHPTGRHAWSVAGGGAWLYRQLRRRRPDLVLANGVKAAAVTLPASRLAGKRSVWIKHDHSYDRTLAGILGVLASGVIATASDVGRAVRNSTIIEPPRPEAPKPRAEACEELRALGVPAMPTDALVVGMLARYVPYKGMDTMIRALVGPATTAWHLVAMGGDEPSYPDERERLRRLAAELGVSGRVHLLNHVPDAPRLLSAVDALAMLTRPDGPRTPGREGFGMAALEAMTAGVPVIAIDDGGPVARRIGPLPESPAAAGITVPAGEPERVTAEVTEALLRLLDSRLRASLGEEGHRRANQHPDVRTQVNRCVDAFEAIARRKKSPVKPTS